MATGPKVIEPLRRLREKLIFDAAGCWLFSGQLNNAGYGVLRVGSQSDGSRRWALVHRLAYEGIAGPIPSGLELDHICRVRSCARPSHLRAVTHRENLLAGRNRNSEKSACGSCGGPYSPVGGDGRRRCQACRNRLSRERRAHG